MLEIYTDGSCLDNGNKKNYGGYGVALVRNDEVVGTYKKTLVNTTNNRAEMRAVIHAIVLAQEIRRKGYPHGINIFTDSAYVQMITMRWMYNWEKKGWKKADGKDPENLDLVKTLFNLMQFERAIKIEKIKGHAGHKFNELADDLAREAAEEGKKKWGESNDR